jgi:hypothetical protein
VTAKASGEEAAQKVACLAQFVIPHDTRRLFVGKQAQSVALNAVGHKFGNRVP